MKNTLLLIAVLLVGACATTPTLEEKVAGTYELIDDDPRTKDTCGTVLLKNGIIEDFFTHKGVKKKVEYSFCSFSRIIDDKKLLWSGMGKSWKMVNKELYTEHTYPRSSGYIGVYRINKDGTLTWIAMITENEQTFQKKVYYYYTLKKIK